MLFNNQVNTFTNNLENFVGYTVFNFIGKKFEDEIKKYGKHICVFSNNEKKMNIVKDFLVKYDTNFDEKIFSYDNSSVVSYKRLLRFEDNGKDTFIFINIESNKKKDLTFSDFFSSIYKSDQKYDESGLLINLYFTGKGCLKYYNIIQSQIESLKEDLYIYNVSGADGSVDSSDNNKNVFNSTTTDLIPRSMNTLFFDEDVQGTIENYIDKFLSNYPIYKDRNLLFKTGLLLYGQPGTGKSSLAKAIASYYNCSMVIVDINSFESLDTNILTTCINGDDYRYVVLFEDIDTIFDSLNRDDEDSSVRKSKVINKLLQLLDSNNSPNNVIFIATTNHIEKLDEAILREGRFDLKVQVNPISTKEATRKMCESFNLKESTIDNIVDKEVEYPVKQSKLQNIILSHIENVSVDKIKTTVEEEE